MKAYKTGEVAKLLNVTPLTVRNEIEKGNLKAFKVGTEYRITEEALNEYMGILPKDNMEEKLILMEKELNKYKLMLKNIREVILWK